MFVHRPVATSEIAVAEQCVTPEILLFHGGSYLEATLLGVPLPSYGPLGAHLTERQPWRSRKSECGCICLGLGCIKCPPRGQRGAPVHFLRRVDEDEIDGLALALHFYAYLRHCIRPPRQCGV